jgi:hypothetical protein
MKKLFSLGLVLVLLVSMLSGCALTQLLGDKEITFDDLTITVPGMYLNLLNVANNPDLAFLYGFEDTAVLGIQESVGDVQDAFGLRIRSAKDYANVYISVNNLAATVVEKDGLVTFTYTAEVDGQSFTYLSAVFANAENFWLVQTYCYTENFEKNEADFMECLKSVKV